MIHKIGYACINLNLKPRGFKNCRLASVYKYGVEYLREKIINNLILTKDILDWNIENGIYMYRITSDLLPLVDHPDIIRDFTWRWQEDDEIQNHMKDIHDQVIKNNIRLSMHPDQFTVLNSLKEEVVRKSRAYLKYHFEVLKALGGSDIIIHTGGVYSDKKESMKRFVKNFHNLDQNIKSMLRLENDHNSYTVEDVLWINKYTDIPIVLDVHHDRCHHYKGLLKEDLLRIKDTWENTGFIPKIHISSGKTQENDKRHSDYISNKDIKNLINITQDIAMDVMVEAKRKDEAVLNILKVLERDSFCKKE